MQNLPFFVFLFPIFRRKMASPVPQQSEPDDVMVIPISQDEYDWFLQIGMVPESKQPDERMQNKSADIDNEQSEDDDDIVVEVVDSDEGNDEPNSSSKNDKCDSVQQNRGQHQTKRRNQHAPTNMFKSLCQNKRSKPHGQKAEAISQSLSKNNKRPIDQENWQKKNSMKLPEIVFGKPNRSKEYYAYLSKLL